MRHMAPLNRHPRPNHGPARSLVTALLATLLLTSVGIVPAFAQEASPVPDEVATTEPVALPANPAIW